MTREWTLGAVLDAIADADPDLLMTVCGSRRSTLRESALRPRRLANFLVDRGFGAHVEEVEDVLRADPGIADALVVGRGSHRWGEEVVAVVALAPSAEVT